MRFRTTVLTAFLVAAPLAAQAQPATGLYIGAGVGENFMQSDTDKSRNGFPSPGRSLQTDIRAIGVGSLGPGFGDGFRTEVAFGFRYNGLDHVINPGSPTVR